MYVFTNGKVVFDKETRDKYLNSGMILEKTINEEPEKVEVEVEEKIEEEVEVEDKTNDDAIERKPKKGKKPFKRV